MPMLPSAPVPQELREMLKNYPEYIERLQEVLVEFTTPKINLMPFDQAIWLLEGRLETFMSEARAEVKAAEANGDAQAVARAKEKRSVMGSARLDMGNLDELWGYFETHKEAFQ